MEDSWTTRPLEDCMSALIDYRGKTPEKASFGIPLITAKVVKGGRIETPDEFISANDYDSWMRRGIPKPGDVVITTEAPLGEVAQLGTERVALAQRLIAMRGKEGVLDNGFLKFLMQSDDVQDQLRARASGTTVLGIKQSELRKVLLTLPTIDEQHAIAHTLGTLDDKIELNRRMNETLEAMARALFKSWFVDFDPVRDKAEGRDPGLPEPLADLFPDSLEDSALGEIPKGWDVGNVSDLCTGIYSGGTPNTRNPDFWGGDVPWLSSGETREKFIVNTERRITLAGVSGSSTRPAPAQATVIASAGQGNTRGQTSLLTFESYINQSVVALIANPRTSSPYHLFFDLERRYEEFRRISDGHSSRGSLTTKLLAGLDAVLPPGDTVRNFDATVAPVVERVVRNLRESQTLTALRDTLLPKLVSGEVRVKDADAFVSEGGLMTDINLTQAEADVLIALAKQRVDDTEWEYPALGGVISVPLVSADRREQFLLDVRRGRIDLAKGTYQNRARQVVVLVRLDFGGAPHRNPDGEEIASPHLHLYREGFGDKWAFPVSSGQFTDLANPWRTLEEFMRFCNIVEPPIIRRGLFT